jgi:uncharacterized small protein (DUF1192 family)
VSSADGIANLEARVAALLEDVVRLTGEVERLKPFEARVAVLEAENAALKEKLSKSSRNSSKPPSSDGPKEKAINGMTRSTTQRAAITRSKRPHAATIGRQGRPGPHARNGCSRAA